MKWKQPVIFVLLCAGVWLIAEGWLGKRGLQQVRELIKQYHVVVTQVNETQKENLILQGEIHRLKNDNFWVEKQAREKLGWVKPGEIVYKFKTMERKENRP